MTTLYEDDVLPTGKYKDILTVKQVAQKDSRYLKWFQATMGRFCISQEVMDKLHQAKTTVPRHKAAE